MPRSTATHRPRRQPETLSTEILDLSLAQAFTLARAWWAETYLLDDLDEVQVHLDLDALVRAATDLQISSYGDALTRTEDLITRTSAVPHLHQFLTTAESHTVYRIRHHLGAALAAVAQSANDSPAPVIKALPVPKPRAGGISRRLLDDEVLLMRHRATRSIHTGGRHRRAGIQYTLVEAGALPVETTRIHLNDFDAPRHPAEVRLPGATHHKARTVTLPRWTQPLLAKAFDAHLAHSPRALTSTVAYGGTSESPTNPSAAASLMLRRTMISAGLTEDCPRPMGVTKWRVQRALDTTGITGAQALLGKEEPIPVHKFIGPQPITVKTEPPTCTIRSFDV